MSNNDKRNLEDQEIDLSVISGKISGFSQSIGRFVFSMIQFVIKHIVVFGILFLFGVGLGYYVDSTKKSYIHQIIVQPNFGSTDYLYSKVELLESKIKQRDTLFLKAIGIQKPSDILNIKIKPIIDVYKFISSSGDKNTNEQNFELLKLMADDGDMKKIVEEKTTSKNYAFHLISFNTKKITTNKNVIEPLLKYLNNSLYFNQIKNVYIKNAQIKIARNDEIIAQIDGFLNDYSKSDANSKSDKLVYYNENTQLNEVIQTKNGLIAENGKMQLDMVSIDEIVKASSTTTNIQDTGFINGKRKYIFPMVFISIYMLIFAFINFYKKQSQKNKES
jgi:hypothetical protein